MADIIAQAAKHWSFFSSDNQVVSPKETSHAVETGKPEPIAIKVQQPTVEKVIKSKQDDSSAKSIFSSIFISEEPEQVEQKVSILLENPLTMKHIGII